MSFSFFNSFNGNSQRLGQNYAIVSQDINPPAAVSYIGADTSSVTFSFTAPRTGGTISGYSAYVNGKLYNGTGGPSSYTINGLAQGGQYTINMVANIASTSSTSTTVTGSFNPTSITGVQLWFDALDPLNTGTAPANGSSITTWYDKSGYGRNAISASSNIYNTTGLNNKPAITINTVSNNYQWLSGTVPITTNKMNVFVIMSIIPGAGDYSRLVSLAAPGIFDSGSDIYHSFIIAGSTNTILYSIKGSSVTTGVAPGYSIPSLCESWFDGTNNYTTVQMGNSTTIASTATSAGNFAISSFTLGADSQSISDYRGWFKGFISEVLVYNTALSTSDRQKIEGYLAWKWSIQTSLPTAHPYYSAAPPGSPTTITTTTTKNILSNPSASLVLNTLAPFPTNIQLISATTTSLTFSFSEPTIGPTPTSYVPYVNGSSTTGSGGPSSYTISGLTAGTNYSLSIGANVTTSGSFNPTSLTGCQLWFDATDPLNTGTAPANGSSLTTWYDKSGYNRNATSASSNIYNTTGLNNKPAITISMTSNQWLNGPVPITTNTATVFVIMSMNSNAGFAGRIISFSQPGVHDWNNNNSFTFIRNGGSNVIIIYKNGTYSSSSFPSYSVPYLCECWLDGTNANSTVQIGNSTSISSVSSSGNFNITSFAIGNDSTFTDPVGQFDGFISEILVYNTSLSLSDRQKVEGYLSWKWGLQANLPSAHPYYSAGPSNTTTTLYQNPSPVSLYTLFNYPTNIQLLSSTASSLTVSFTAPGSNPTSYTPYLNAVAGTGSGTPSSYTITGLNGGTNYSVSIGANVTTTGSFTPTSISGTLLWLDAADSTTITYSSGSKISQWSDKSGLNYHFTQSTVANQPSYVSMANGKPALSLTSSGVMLNNNIPVSTTCTIFGVGYSSAGGNARLVQNDGYFYFGGISNSLAIGAGTNSVWSGVINANPATSISSLCLMEMSNSNNIISPYVNGTALDTTTIISSSFTGLTIGGVFFSGSYTQLWGGYVSEILIYNSVLSTTDRQKVEGYLANKWLIQSSLPVAHPYYSATPTSNVTVIYQNPTPLSLTTALSPPTGLTFISATATSITFSFTNPSGTITGYTPYINGSTATGSGNASSYTITGLTAGTSYTISISASTASSTSIQSTSVSMSTIVNRLKQNLSASAQSAFVGAFSVYLISSTYTGPSLNIRRSTDNATSDFYSDAQGNLGQSIGATGTSITSWLSGATGYVTKWFDQSGTGNHATQTTNGSQPSINVSSKYVDFSSPGNSFFNLPNGAIPYGNSSYTFVLKHGSIPYGQTWRTFIGSGTWMTVNGMNDFYINNNSNYYTSWYGNDLNGGTVSSGNTVSTKYKTNVSRTIYVNGVSAVSDAPSGRNTNNTNNSIGIASQRQYYLNMPLHFLYIFGTDLTDADRLIAEAGQ